VLGGHDPILARQPSQPREIVHLIATSTAQLGWTAVEDCIAGPKPHPIESLISNSPQHLRLEFRALQADFPCGKKAT
jgi:hypothetical protein